MLKKPPLLLALIFSIQLSAQTPLEQLNASFAKNFIAQNTSLGWSDLRIDKFEWSDSDGGKWIVELSFRLDLLNKVWQPNPHRFLRARSTAVIGKGPTDSSGSLPSMIRIEKNSEIQFVGDIISALDQAKKGAISSEFQDRFAPIAQATGANIHSFLEDLTERLEEDFKSEINGTFNFSSFKSPLLAQLLKWRRSGGKLPLSLYSPGSSPNVPETVQFALAEDGIIFSAHSLMFVPLDPGNNIGRLFQGGAADQEKRRDAFLTLLLNDGPLQQTLPQAADEVVGIVSHFLLGNPSTFPKLAQLQAAASCVPRILGFVP